MEPITSSPPVYRYLDRVFDSGNGASPISLCFRMLKVPPLSPCPLCLLPLNTTVEFFPYIHIEIDISI